ncbi:MAG: hypothetical protein QXZ43_01320 [Candidatus Aenigmatarchaeota archaeon]
MLNRTKLIVLLLLFLPSVYSLEQISLTFAGYGKTTNEVLLTVHNTGDQNLQGLLVFVDRMEYERNPDILLEPKKGFEMLLYLEPGQHEIYVSLGNADQTITLNVPEKGEYKEETNIVKENRMVLVVTIVVILIVIIFLLKREIIFNIKTKLI